MPFVPNRSDQDEEDGRAPRWPQVMNDDMRTVMTFFSRSNSYIRGYRSSFPSSVLRNNINNNRSNSNHNHDDIEDDDDDDDSSSSSSSSDEDLPPLLDYRYDDSSSSSDESSDDELSNGSDDVHEIQQIPSRPARSSPRWSSYDDGSVSIFMPVDIDWFLHSSSRLSSNRATMTESDRGTSHARFIVGDVNSRQARYGTTTATTKGDGYIGPDVHQLMYNEGSGRRDRVSFHVSDGDDGDDDDDDDDGSYEDYDDDQDSEYGDNDLPDHVDDRQATASVHVLNQSRRVRRTIVVWDSDVTLGRRQRRGVGNNLILIQ